MMTKSKITYLETAIKSKLAVEFSLHNPGSHQRFKITKPFTG